MQLALKVPSVAIFLMRYQQRQAVLSGTQCMGRWCSTFCSMCSLMALDPFEIRS